jgi:putative endonuclease
VSARAGRGAAVEDATARWLAARGLVLRERNVRCRFGEIDLVLLDGEVLVFAEVRLRSHDGYGGAAGSVDGRKQARIIACARWYLGRNPGDAERTCRFDVLAVDERGAVTWLRDAFRPES